MRGSHSSEHGLTKAVVWANRIPSLTQELSCDIARTLDACDRFLQVDADDFDDEPGGTRNVLIIELEQHIESLRRLQRHLEAMTSKCGFYASNVGI